MTVLRDVLARFGVDVETGPLDTANKKIDGLIGGFRAAGAALAGGFALSGIQSFVQETVRATEEVRLQAETLGLSTQRIQELGFAATAVGRPLDDMVDAIGTLQERARDALIDPKSDPAEQLRLLGVSAKDASGELKDSETLLFEVSDSLANMTNQTDRVGAAMTLFGDVGRHLLPVLQRGSAGLEEMAEAARAAGGGFDEASIQAGQEMARATREADFAMRSLKGTILVAILPGLQWLASGAARLARGLKTLWENSNILQTALIVLGGYVLALGLKMTAAFAGPILVIGAIIAAFVALYLVVEDLVVLFQGGESVIGDAIDALFGVGSATKFVHDMKEAWEAVYTAIATATNGLLEFLGLNPFFDEDKYTSSGRASTDEDTIQERQARAAAEQGQVVRFPGESQEEAQARFQRLRAEIGGGPEASRQVPRPRPSGGARVEQRNEVNVTVQGGGDPDETARQIRRVFREETDRQNRQAAAALVEEVE